MAEGGPPAAPDGEQDSFLLVWNSYIGAGKAIEKTALGLDAPQPAAQLVPAPASDKLVNSLKGERRVDFSFEK
jgi:hypothetical protein